MVRLLCLVVVMTLAGCSRPQAMDGSAPMAAGTAQGRDKFLAYQHAVTIDTGENQIKPLLERLTGACQADRENGCTLLKSSLGGGRREDAFLRVRAKPAGINKLLALAAAGGELARQETSVEDLARPVSDSAKRLEMLRVYQQRLTELERKPGIDADALIKLAREQASVQAELEQASGENAHLMARINLDLLDIHIQSGSRLSFWSPIQRSLSDFNGNLSSGIASTLTGLAYLLPWSLILALIWWLARKLWRRRGAAGNK
ncbi:hypothetical protein RugamoR64_42680 [Duganella rhizosphaerae]|uniref:DUF4349 domain-containing protein n=1 Tax=Duganella rhizosphaerae TaxID=2885763 RepID=UPI0030EA075A